MAEEQKRGPGRPRKEPAEETERTPFEARRAEAKSGDGPRAGFAAADSYADEQLKIQNDQDERQEDRRPGTLKDRNTGEAYPDNRKPPIGLANAANQMAQKPVFTANTSPFYHLEHPELQTPGGPVPRASTMEPFHEEDGDELVLLKGIMATEFTKHQPGTIIRRPRAEAKRLVNAGVARFTEDE